MPTLIIWGDRDLYVPQHDQTLLAERIAGSKLIIYRDTGHAPHWEEPARFSADVAQFVSTVDRAKWNVIGTNR